MLDGCDGETRFKPSASFTECLGKASRTARPLLGFAVRAVGVVGGVRLCSEEHVVVAIAFERVG